MMNNGAESNPATTETLALTSMVGADHRVTGLLNFFAATLHAVPILIDDYEQQQNELIASVSALISSLKLPVSDEDIEEPLDFDEIELKEKKLRESFLQFVLSSQSIDKAQQYVSHVQGALSSLSDYLENCSSEITQFDWSDTISEIQRGLSTEEEKKLFSLMQTDLSRSELLRHSERLNRQREESSACELFDDNDI